MHVDKEKKRNQKSRQGQQEGPVHPVKMLTVFQKAALSFRWVCVWGGVPVCVCV